MNQEPPSRLKNMTLAVVAGQAGCFTLVVIFVALFIGIWLDAQLGLRGVFTIGLLLMSIPVSLIFMVRIALGAVNNLQLSPPKQQDSTGSKATSRTSSKTSKTSKTLQSSYTEEEDL